MLLLTAPFIMNHSFDAFSCSLVNNCVRESHFLWRGEAKFFRFWHPYMQTAIESQNSTLSSQGKKNKGGREGEGGEKKQEGPQILATLFMEFESQNSTLSLESRKEEQGKEREIERGEARSSSDSLATFLKRRHRGKMGKEKCEEKLEDEDDVERESNQRMKMSGMKRTMRRKKSRVLRSPFAELLDKTMTKRSHKGNNVRFPNKE
ncbi:uncharacterized protein LOC127811550 isoform X1 [Diospyros lotus]|uniref:uncharacterized protein LOC127811550 isoform X1 n=1 Tax=Diospyros lotus TaxID=55363 RepID=UPI00225929F8|nr:uncharacterized protein LOC127811550 isoform X1 [Diospyros lotus]